MSRAVRGSFFPNRDLVLWIGPGSRFLATPGTATIVSVRRHTEGSPVRGDPRQTVAPLVETLLELREQAREEGSWTVADTLRDRLTAAGIEVRDTAQGASWLLAGSSDTG